MDEKIAKYISKQKSPQKEICQKLHSIITSAFPGIREEMKWGVPTYGKACYYIVSLKDHVNLGFSLAGLKKSDYKLLEGEGKTMRHLKYYAFNEIDEKKIVKLLKLVKCEKLS